MFRLCHVLCQAEGGGESVPRCLLQAECQVSDRFRLYKKLGGQNRAEKLFLIDFRRILSMQCLQLRARGPPVAEPVVCEGFVAMVLRLGGIVSFWQGDV